MDVQARGGGQFWAVGPHIFCGWRSMSSVFVAMPYRVRPSDRHPALHFLDASAAMLLCFVSPRFDLCNACCHLSHTWGGKCERFASQRWRCAACACSFITFSLRASVCSMFSHKSAQRGSRTPKKAQVVCFICPALIFFVNEVLRTSNILFPNPPFTNPPFRRTRKNSAGS